jgi:diguanylate cyclase (GGDEF)-like protein
MKDQKRILVVDDDKFNTALMRELCENAGHFVEEANNGIDAIEMAISNPPDLILLDIMMSGKDGFEVCRELRDNQKTIDLPIIIVTALEDLFSKVRGIELGADDYITKPFRLFELQQRIRIALESRYYRRQLKEAEDKLKKLGEIDTPGRIGGYRQLRCGLEYEFNRAQRYEHSLSCVLMIIDGYEQTRENNGQKAAANLIGIVTTSLKDCLRSVDRTYRLDAGQFIIILPETDKKGARVAIERIRQDLKKPPKDDIPVITTTSILATYPHPNVKTSQEILRIISQANPDLIANQDSILEFDGFVSEQPQFTSLLET